MRNFLRYADVAELLQIKVGTLYSMMGKSIPHVRVSNRLVSTQTSQSWLRIRRLRLPQQEEAV